jgi:hypothetical protein
MEADAKRAPIEVKPSATCVPSRYPGFLVMQGAAFLLLAA